MLKRKADEAGLTPPETVAEVAVFVKTGCPEPFATAAAEKVHENAIDGAVLRSMSEKDLDRILGLNKFGIRRKLYTRISELFKTAPAKQSEIRATPGEPLASVPKTNPVATERTPLGGTNILQQQGVKIEITNVAETNKAAEHAMGVTDLSADEAMPMWNEDMDAAKVEEQLQAEASCAGAIRLNAKAFSCRLIDNLAAFYWRSSVLRTNCECG
eukprot:1187678-Prorocentrum_minimum.AAC.4